MWFPGWPGPAMNGRRARIPQVAMPASPGLPTVPAHPGGPPAGAYPPPTGPGAPHSPLAGLAAFGVPVGHTPDGRPFIQTGRPGHASMLPPDIPGLPSMPPPPGELLNGRQGAGLFRPLSPVAPFDPTNQVQQLRGQQPPQGGA